MSKFVSALMEDCQCCDFRDNQDIIPNAGYVSRNAMDEVVEPVPVQVSKAKNQTYAKKPSLKQQPNYTRPDEEYISSSAPDNTYTENKDHDDHFSYEMHLVKEHAEQTYGLRWINTNKASKMKFPELNSMTLKCPLMVKEILPGGNFDIHNQERVKHGLPKVEHGDFIYSVNGKTVFSEVEEELKTMELKLVFKRFVQIDAQ